jgi:Uma2 family endonuclease
MTIAADRKLLTVDEFMARPDARYYELIDGNLVERNVGTRSSYIAGRILSALIVYNDAQKIGWPFDADTVYQCFGSGHTGRKMDGSFVCRGRLPGERIPDGHMQIAPDLAIEVVSPNDSAYEVDEKVSLYLNAGVKLIWLVYPESRSIQVKRAGGPPADLQANQELTGEPALPGFRAPVATFFPPLENVETTP